MAPDTVDCIFCGIVAGEVPAEVVLRSDSSVAFRDLNPQAPTHVLVVPVRHIRDAAELQGADASELVDLFLTAKQVAADEGFSESGFRLVFNVGDHAQNSVPHLHLHVLGGRQMSWPPG
jgi:histidine triad (HIT) family protein